MLTSSSTSAKVALCLCSKVTLQKLTSCVLFCRPPPRLLGNNLENDLHPVRMTGRCVCVGGGRCPGGGEALEESSGLDEKAELQILLQIRDGSACDPAAAGATPACMLDSKRPCCVFRRAAFGCLFCEPRPSSAGSPSSPASSCSCLWTRSSGPEKLVQLCVCWHVCLLYSGEDCVSIK